MRVLKQKATHEQTKQTNLSTQAAEGGYHRGGGLEEDEEGEGAQIHGNQRKLDFWW